MPNHPKNHMFTTFFGPANLMSSYIILYHLISILGLELVLLPAEAALSSLLKAKAMMEAAKPQPRSLEGLQSMEKCILKSSETHRTTGH